MGESENKGVTGRLRSWFLRFLEGFLDASDAIRRRKKADQIYRDMEAERISPARAAQEIQILNKRQKGGWLDGDLTKWRAAKKMKKSENSTKRRKRKTSRTRLVSGVEQAVGG